MIAADSVHCSDEGAGSGDDYQLLKQTEVSGHHSAGTDGRHTAH